MEDCLDPWMKDEIYRAFPSRDWCLDVREGVNFSCMPDPWRSVSTNTLHCVFDVVQVDLASGIAGEHISTACDIRCISHPWNRLFSTTRSH